MKVNQLEESTEKLRALLDDDARNLSRVFESYKDLADKANINLGGKSVHFCMASLYELIDEGKIKLMPENKGKGTSFELFDGKSAVTIQTPRKNFKKFTKMQIKLISLLLDIRNKGEKITRHSLKKKLEGRLHRRYKPVDLYSSFLRFICERILERNSFGYFSCGSSYFRYISEGKCLKNHNISHKNEERISIFSRQSLLENGGIQREKKRPSETQDKWVKVARRRLSGTPEIVSAYPQHEAGQRTQTNFRYYNRNILLSRDGGFLPSFKKFSCIENFPCVEDMQATDKTMAIHNSIKMVVASEIVKYCERKSCQARSAELEVEWLRAAQLFAKKAYNINQQTGWCGEYKDADSIDINECVMNEVINYCYKCGETMQVKNWSDMAASAVYRRMGDELKQYKEELSRQDAAQTL